jgi:hypothetical protein
MVQQPSFLDGQLSIVLGNFELLKYLSSKTKLGVNVPNFLMDPTLKHPDRGSEFPSQGVEETYRNWDRSPSILNCLLETIQLGPKSLKMESGLPWPDGTEAEEERAMIRSVRGSQHSAVDYSGTFGPILENTRLCPV